MSKTRDHTDKIHTKEGMLGVAEACRLSNLPAGSALAPDLAVAAGPAERTAAYEEVQVPAYAPSVE